MKRGTLSAKENRDDGMGNAVSHIIFDNVMLHMMFIAANTMKQFLEN